jgi:glycosyltransferase Alg8
MLPARLSSESPEPGAFTRELLGWALFAAALGALAQMLPATVFQPGHADYLLLIGAVALWRYSLGLVHFVRAMVFLHWVFPGARRAAAHLGALARPSHVYFLVTSYRIDAGTTTEVYRSVIAEAQRCGSPATLVASIVDAADEHLIRALWDRAAPGPGLRLSVVRIPGTGKRDGLAGAMRAIAQDRPDRRAVVAVIDGDSVLRPGIIGKTAPYLALFPNIGALTTNEFCRVEGGPWITQWHRLRFAQRHINMCSMALSHRVLTLTGRMSLFRADVVTHPGFIDDIEHDALEHWRLGRFRFLTGDDKSSWFSLVRHGWDTWYAPDAAIDTLESPPDKSFFTASRKLMFRWYGNSLRQNSRAVRLGPGRLGLFTYYVLWDQRVSMWTSLLGLTGATVASLRYGAHVFAAYALWVGLSRLWMTLMLTFATGHHVSPRFPLLLYYNQIVGSLIKIHAFYHLDQQSWTRQKTTLQRDLDPWQLWFNRWSSRAMTFSAGSVFAAFVLRLV